MRAICICGHLCMCCTSAYMSNYACGHMCVFLCVCLCVHMPVGACMCVCPSACSAVCMHSKNYAPGFELVSLCVSVYMEEYYVYTCVCV